MSADITGSYYTGSYPVGGTSSISLPRKLLFRGRINDSASSLVFDEEQATFQAAVHGMERFTSSISASAIVDFTNFNAGDTFGFYICGKNYLHTSYRFLETPITASVNQFQFTMVQSGSYPTYTQRTVFEPNFPKNWDNNIDCHALINDIQDNRLNPFIQEVEYNTGQLVPTNITAISSESAVKIAIPESNYTALKSINSRYLGSKIQSEKINEWTPNGSWGNNIGTFGKTPSINSLSNTIFEFDFANASPYTSQNTTPYLPNIGTINMRKIYEVSTPSSVKTIDPLKSSKVQLVHRPTQMTGSIGLTYNFEFSSSYNNISQSVNDFYYAINNNLTTNTPIQISQYSPTVDAVSPSTTKILSTGFGKTLGRNAYIITSSDLASGEICATLRNTNCIAFFNSSSRIYLNSNDSNHNYTQGPQYNTVQALSSGSGVVDGYGNDTSIQLSLKSGERWFITLFTELSSSFNPDTLYSYNYGFDGVKENGDLEYPLQYHGVHEILAFESGSDIGNTSDGGVIMVVDSIFKENALIGRKHIVGVYPSSIGAVIWKADLNQDLVLTQDNIHHVGKGAFTTEYPISDITDNFDEITRDFGANQT